ncbi:DUF4239 domain-containing protein [Nocardia terpenica]|uniref:DUF4239 domain-containing protein n=1 Tax=Nocardia terpenica TaxID=455432 RepID=A0A164IBF0_9NOCA|nr:DUF4239 domain-containing protein [Nocardia terpenica]KZM69275.1 hypothetical protein AWN90_09690 [Nocardia terpenica]NQE88938.1 DUF4239 domain-containing protein [Nocardia terpenica]
MFTWVYEMPSWLSFLVITGVFVAITCSGVIIARPGVRKIFARQPGMNEMVTMVLTVGGVFYGLLLGLTAAATYQSFDSANTIVADEAATLGVLYREVSAYPEPERGVLQKDLVDYTDNAINVAWPALRKGEESTIGTALVTRFQQHLLAFHPQTESDKIVHAAAIEQFAHFIQVRLHRLADSSGGIPNLMWTVIVIGAAVNIALMCLFTLEHRTAHLVLAGLFAFFLATMIYLIAAMDYPFRGDLSISPEPFITTYIIVMGQTSH